MPKKTEKRVGRGQARSPREYYHTIHAVEIVDGNQPRFILGNGDEMVLRFQGDASGAICAAYWEITSPASQGKGKKKASKK